MANVLILESDPVAAALLADFLHVSGHQTMLVDGPVQAISKASGGRFDLLILDLETALVPGREVILQLRAQRETRSLPIIALSAKPDSPDRLAALRAGADEVLTRPVDAEELLLRANRLLGYRGDGPTALQGDLAQHPVYELAQYIQSSGKSGELVVHGSRGSGQLVVDGGRMVSARWEHLRGREALLALLDNREGRFRLTAEPPAGTAPEGAGSTIEDALIRFAWLTDQLARRRRFLPATGAALKLTGREPPALDEELEGLPIESICSRLREQPGQRLYDLLQGEDAAPPKVRLAVAWMAEQGVLEATAASAPASTGEIVSSQILDLAVHNLLNEAGGAGFEISEVTYLVLVEPEVKPRLIELLAHDAGVPGIAALGELLESLKRGESGRADFATDFGALSLHVQILAPAYTPRIEALVPTCAGVLIWLDRCHEVGLLWRVVQELEAAAAAAVGIVVAERPEVRESLARLTANTRRWQISHRSPYSLIGILRLLRPRSG